MAQVPQAPLVLLALAACGDSTGSTADASTTSGSTGAPPSSTGAPLPTTGPTAATSTGGSGDATGDGSSTAASTGMVFDLPPQADFGAPCGSGCGDGSAFSYIWIANPAGTVSKIETLTAANSGEYGERSLSVG